MASSPPSPAAPGRPYEWLVVVPDKPGTRHLRLEARPQHLVAAQQNKEAGRVLMGGAILENVPPDDEPAKIEFAGSSFVVQATSREEILDFLARDVYATNVWDLDKVQIWPFKNAFPKAS